VKEVKKTKILFAVPAVCVLLLAAGIFSGCKGRPANVWYIERGLEDVWTRVLREADPPEIFKERRVWEGGEIPGGPGILIATKPREKREKVSVYYRLSFDLEYEGAAVLALDPWMVFRKHTNPGLTLNRAYSDAGGSGLLLIPGKDTAAVQAWTARLILERPGVFPSGENIWQIREETLFNGNRFPRGAQTYNWNDVFFRLMGNEPAWVYAPLSEIRRYRDSRKAVLEASAFPEPESGGQYSLQASLLWALPLGSPKEQEALAQTVSWLKKPETQTVIADILEWIPADPYGEPYDPVSLASHRNWLTATYIYEVEGSID
jgi:hypothetical protein